MFIFNGIASYYVIQFLSSKFLPRFDITRLLSKEMERGELSEMRIQELEQLVQVLRKERDDLLRSFDAERKYI